MTETNDGLSGERRAAIRARLEQLAPCEAYQDEMEDDPVTRYVCGKCDRNEDTHLIRDLLAAVDQITEARDQLTGGAALIAAERARQVSEEGWTPAHDDTHAYGELCGAAMCYIADRDVATSNDPPFGWPWEPAGWKPSNDPVRNLAKAGALIAAEIDRLRRKTALLQEWC